ncbi:hypothetical protein A6A06_18825 [Streptomyces sp. CB02923]|uniref:IS701 family transposase n=1 Tax=Streptomyces sp. CB02923 TaxID=1718985 RepID=UPI0009397FAF|nr:transposase [Streptomyces sp. CB02923]OKI00944.1 hypothetical protein A6A06_18825 [Streptomyces sp. CB02923]
MASHPTAPTEQPAPTEQLSEFTSTVFSQLRRAEQRRWGHAYLLGLLTVPGKKTVRRLAAAVADSPTASQSFQQFINSSPWEWEPVRHELARWIDVRLRPQAWTITTAVLPKRGDHSCGVHRRFVPRLGQTVNCQVGVGLFLSDGATAVPVDWRLHLPDHWALPHPRRLARIPCEAASVPMWADALDMADRLRRVGGVHPAPLVADMCDRSEANDMLHLLTRQRCDFVVAVPGSLPVLPLDASDHGSRAAASVLSLGTQRSLVLSDVRHARSTTGAERDGAHHGSDVQTSLVRLPSATVPGSGSLGTYRLFTHRRPGRRYPAVIWITNMVRRRVKDLLALVDSHTGTEDSVRELVRDFGLQDFEGRSYPGWHHHMTLTSAAHAYRRLAGLPQAAHPALEPMSA